MVDKRIERCAGLLLMAVGLGACQALAPRPQTPPLVSAATAQPAAAAATTPASPGLPVRAVHRGLLPPQRLSAPPPPVAPSSAEHLADGHQLPAVHALLVSAEHFRKKGRLDLASHRLEQALRLAPQSAEIYGRLAELRLQQHRPAEAEHLARRGLLYARHIEERERLKAIIRMSRPQAKPSQPQGVSR